MKRFCGLALSCIVIVLVVALSGCRGDWTHELPNNYRISRINSYQIALCRNIEGSAHSEYVIEKYYVFSVCVTGDYILTSGVPTEKDFATDQELTREARTYYAVNYETGEISGPFHQEKELMTLLNSPEIELTWLYTRDLP